MWHYLKWPLSTIQKGNTQRDTLNKIIYVIVQSAFLTNNNNKKKKISKMYSIRMIVSGVDSSPTRAPVMGEGGAWNDFDERSVSVCVCAGGFVCVYLLLYT